MGLPAEKVRFDNETVWYYPRAPEGRDTYAARFTPDGRLVGIEQRLTKENFARIVPGQSTITDLREVLGPPWRIDPARKGGATWDYRVMVDMRKFDFIVEVSEEGVVRHTFLLHDPEYDAPGPRGR